MCVCVYVCSYGQKLSEGKYMGFRYFTQNAEKIGICKEEYLKSEIYKFIGNNVWADQKPYCCHFI